MNSTLLRFVHETLDPTTAKAYEYRTLDSLAYELCAEFGTTDSEGGPGGLGTEFWRHGPGRKGFRFQVTPRSR